MVLGTFRASPMVFTQRAESRTLVSWLILGMGRGWGLGLSSRLDASSQLSA